MATLAMSAWYASSQVTGYELLGNTMSKTLDAIRKLPYVSAIYDERSFGSSIIVELKTGWEFCSEDDGCGVKGFWSVTEARSGCTKTKVQTSVTHKLRSFPSSHAIDVEQLTQELATFGVGMDQIAKVRELGRVANCGSTR